MGKIIVGIPISRSGLIEQIEERSLRRLIEGASSTAEVAGLTAAACASGKGSIVERAGRVEDLKHKIWAASLTPPEEWYPDLQCKIRGCDLDVEIAVLSDIHAKVLQGNTLRALLHNMGGGERQDADSDAATPNE